MSQKVKINVYGNEVVLSNIRNNIDVPIFGRNDNITASITTQWWDGSEMDDSKVDDKVYLKLRSLPSDMIEEFGQYIGSYLKINLPNEGELFLEKDTVAQMRGLSSTEILLLKMGYYKGVKLNGYYQEGDTPAPIEYYLSDIVEEDDGGSVIEIGGIKLEHDFEDEVYVEYYGVSENNQDNGIIISKILLKYENLVTLNNKNYLFSTPIDVEEKKIKLTLGLNTEFISIAKTNDGVYPTKILNIINSPEVIISGIFNGGYYVEGSPVGSPKASSFTSSLINILDSDEVHLNIEIKNNCSNWSDVVTLENIMSYGALYVRGCKNVFCDYSKFNSSRIEGFVFLGNDNVTVKNLISKEHISVWTPLHLFLNKNVNVDRVFLEQGEVSSGSTLNLYNNYSRVTNSTIRYGAGIDHSWEVTGLDVSSFNIKPIRVDILRNDYFSTSRILYSIYHSGEIFKEKVTVSDNVYETDKLDPKENVSSLIRVDATKNVVIERNYGIAPIQNLSLFQSVGGIELLEINHNNINADNLLRLTQVNTESLYDYGIIKVNNNSIDCIPIDGRSLSSMASSFAYVSKSVLGNIGLLEFTNNNIFNSEGRVFQISGNSISNTVPKVEFKNNKDYQGGDITYYTSFVKDVVIDNNESRNPRIFANISNISGDLKIVNNTENSTEVKVNGMIGAISGNINNFVFKNNKFNVPNPTTYGIINSVSNLLSVGEKSVYDNTPEVSPSKTLVANNITGWSPKGIEATPALKGLVNQSLSVGEITTPDATDEQTTMDLVNELKEKINEILIEEKNSGQMES